MAAPVYVERPPTPELRGLVRRLWFLSAHTPGGTERIVPIPWVHVIVNLGDPYRVERQGERTVGDTFDDAFVSGLQHSYLVNTNPRHLHHVGATLEAYAWRSLGADPFIDDVRDAAQVLPRVSGVRSALGTAPTPDDALDALDAALVGSLSGRSPDPVVVSTTREIEANPGERIGKIADRVGSSRSALAPRFRRATGTTPKQYADVHRFHAFVSELAAPGALPTWTEMVARTSYYDQPHFIRTFAKFTGSTPRQFLRSLGDAGRATPSFVSSEDE